MSPLRPRMLGAVLVLLTSLGACHAEEVQIALKNRIRNRPEDRSAWCAVETLGRHHGIEALNGLADKHTTRAMPIDLEAVLDDLQIDYRTQPVGSHSTTILRYAIREKLGAIVAFRERTPGQGPHMVTVVDFTDNEVRVIDSNDGDGRIRTMSRKRFLSWWNGFALVLEKHEDLSFRAKR